MVGVGMVAVTVVAAVTVVTCTVVAVGAGFHLKGQHGRSCF